MRGCPRYHLNSFGMSNFAARCASCSTLAGAGQACEPGAAVKNHLRALRAERGWSQAELAERLDVSRQSVNAIETGKYDPDHHR